MVGLVIMSDPCFGALNLLNDRVKVASSRVKSLDPSRLVEFVLHKNTWFALSSFCIEERDVLVARVIIHAYNDHVRLLAPESLVVNNHSRLGSKEPTLLCDQVSL